MSEETKEQLQVVLELLRSCCIKNGVSAGFDKEDEKLVFFDTETYLQENRFAGISVSLDDLVN